MEIVKKSVNQTEVIKKEVSSGFKTDLALDESLVRRIICPRATVRVEGVTKTNAGITVSARAALNVLYEGDAGLEVYESGVDFSVEVPFDGEYLHEPVTEITADEVTVTAGAGGYTLTAQVTLTAEFLVVKAVEYVEDVENAINKRVDFSCLSYFDSCVRNFEAVEEKTYPYVIKRMLCADEKTRVLSVSCGANVVVFDAEAGGEYLFLTDSGERVRESVWFPVRFEAELDGVTPDMVAAGAVKLCGAAYKVESSEADGATTVTFSYLLRFFGEVYEVKARSRVDDCFSASYETSISRTGINYKTSCEMQTFKGKCFGEAACTKDGDIKAVLNACLYGLSYSVTADKLSVSGVIKAEVLTENDDGVFKRAVCELPFTSEFAVRYPVITGFSGVVKGVSVKEFDGKCVLEGETTFTAVCFGEKTETVLSDATFGDEKPVDDCAVSMIFVKKGEDSWDVCKKAGVSEKQLKEQNPAAEFPAGKDYVISVYRKIDI